MIDCYAPGIFKIFKTTKFLSCLVFFLGRRVLPHFFTLKDKGLSKTYKKVIGFNMVSFPCSYHEDHQHECNRMRCLEIVDFFLVEHDSFSRNNEGFGSRKDERS